MRLATLSTRAVLAACLAPLAHRAAAALGDGRQADGPAMLHHQPVDRQPVGGW